MHNKLIMKSKNLILLMGLQLFFLTTVIADIRLPTVLTDGMVLQRDKAITIWGWADAQEKLKVSLGNDSATTKADRSGQWSVSLKAQKANSEGQLLTIKGNNTIRIKDVLIGEVWLASGQSNMEFRMNQTANKDDIAKAKYPNIRLFHVKKNKSAFGLDNVQGSWQKCTPESVATFSAVAYHYGKNLHENLNIPIGLISAAVGGTQIEPWTPLEGFQQKEILKEYADLVAGYTKNTRVLHTSPSAYYFAMIHPLLKLKLRGLIWYQGECSLGQKGDGAIYTDKTYALIKGLRDNFQQEDLSFYFVQMPPFLYVGRFKKQCTKTLTVESLPLFNEAQMNCLKTIPNSGMVVVSDKIDKVQGIHPTNKAVVGYRLSLWAMAKNYGRPNIVYSGPLYKSYKVSGNKIIIEFDHVGSGLTTLDGAALTHFQIAGKDRKFIEAKASVVGKTILVESSNIRSPMAVRFSWHEAAIPNFANAEKLPASPFRTYDWK
ncbi:sialate O-acetylesterase [Lentisphaera profundi]|uniref:Sialate O-acetylesterase n=1 Tax=Lentisphaera profundi TaxID=1658616 RepID=A0ABY7VTR0_9BACT|nr:sialate O-acetylesterase [Lentisphaera profundi]WDE97560.1 sialate O-acetylesterase [Lentisphaera profundi]